METSKEMMAMIAGFEGMRLEAYLCPAGVPTIGIGSTTFNGKQVAIGMKITKEQAMEQFKNDLKKFESALLRLLGGYELTQCQFDALVSFIYNVGSGNFSRSSLRRAVMEDAMGFTKIKKSFSLWNKGGGKVLPGLRKRRAIEAAWYMYGSCWENHIGKDPVKWMYG